MGHQARWIGVVAVTACVVGVAATFALATPTSQPTSSVAATAPATGDSAAAATKSVVETANRLSLAISRASAGNIKGPHVVICGARSRRGGSRHPTGAGRY